METKGKMYPYLGGIVGFLLLCIFGLAQGNVPMDVQPRADIIRLDTLAESERATARRLPQKQMPAVEFMHDRHTRAIQETTQGDADPVFGAGACRACHLTQDDGLMFMYKRLERQEPAAERDIYHTHCIGCHTERAAASLSTGPLGSSCRECHRRTPQTDSDWVPLAFNASLHYRHESAELIPPPTGSDANCSACHHQYDTSLQNTAYVQGKEDSCLYCHAIGRAPDGRLLRPTDPGTFKPVGPDNLAFSTSEQLPDVAIRSMSAAAHDACVACHQHLSTTHNRPTGPQDCAGCHTLQGQAKIRVLETVPRLKRNQPDAVLMGAWLTREDLGPQTSSKDIAAEVNPVAFDHQVHEASVAQSASCRTCHHSSLQSCNDCHTPRGAAQGDFISLHQAMHATNAEGTCVGCHQQQTRTLTDCAGCHTARPAAEFQAQNCQLCHNVDKLKLPRFPLADTTRTEVATRTLRSQQKARKAQGTLPSLDQIPDRVRIDALVDTYEAVDMPHRKIVLALNQRTEKHGLAQTFHTDPLTLCGGCHHNSPASVQPPKCAACHSPQQVGPTDGRPALMGAYHLQCMGCHSAMEIEKPQATACLECHPRRQPN